MPLRLVNPDFLTRWKHSFGGGFYALLVLISLVFLPALLGKNPLPFDRLGPYGFAFHTDGVPFVPDARFEARARQAPWSGEPEFAALGLFYPQEIFTARALRAGSLPLWDPFTGCGMPTFDGGQFRPFNPLRAPFYAWPTAWFFGLTAILGAIVGAAGMARLLRVGGHRPDAVVLGAAVFAVNPWILERLVLPEAFAYYALPWCVLGLRGFRWGSKKTWAASAFPFIFMGHAGHPETCLLMALTASAIFVAGGDQTWSRRSLKEAMPALAVAGLGSVLALAVLWVPMITLLAHSESYKQLGARYGFSLYRWQGLFMPFADLYVLPVLAGLSACAGLVWRRCLLPLALVATAALLLMPLPWLGHSVGEAAFRFTGVPPFYAKHLIWIGLALAVPTGWERLRAGDLYVKMFAFSAGFLSLAASIFSAFSLPLTLAQYMVTPTTTLILLAFGLLVLLLLTSSTSDKGGIVLALLAVLPYAWPLSFNQLAWNRESGRLPALAAKIGQACAHERVGRIGESGSSLLLPNVSQAAGIRIAEVTTPFYLNRFFEAFHPKDALPTQVFFNAPDLAAFARLGISRLVVSDVAPPAYATPSYATPFLYDLPDLPGRAYFAETVAPLPPTPSFKALWAVSPPQSRSVFLEPDGALPAPSVEPSGSSRSVRFEVDDLHIVCLNVETDRSSLLVLRDSWYPGWQALVDGHRVPIYRVDGCFRGVQVPAGAHGVTFRYRPWPLYAAGAVSLVTLLLLIWWLIGPLGRDGTGSAFRGRY